MRTILLLLLLSVCCPLSAQFRWTCPAKGRFTNTPGANSPKYYCWDGRTYANAPGYEPPPSFILNYWAQMEAEHNKIQTDMDRLREEIKSNARERERNSTINPRPLPSRPLSSKTLSPADLPVESGPAAPAFVAVPREQFADLPTGTSRATVISRLGNPHSVISIPSSSGLVEILTYTVTGNASATLRIEQGKLTTLKLTP